MEQLLKIFTDSYLFCAIFGGTLFVLMSILTFIGFTHDSDCSCEAHDGDVGEVSILSVKGVIAFVTFYGLGGLCFKNAGWGGWFIAVLCGTVMMFVTAGVIALILKLQHSGNVAPESLVGCAGQVYLSLPGEEKTGGQVTVTLPGSTVTVQAVSQEPLETGTPVEVAEYLGNSLYRVTKRI